MSNENHYCNGCGAKIFWIKTAKGKSLPLNPEPVVSDGNPRSFLWVSDDEHGIVEEGRFVKGLEKGKLGRPSHWATCPKARDFKRSTEPRKDNPEMGRRIYEFLRKHQGRMPDMQSNGLAAEWEHMSESDRKVWSVLGGYVTLKAS